MLQNIEDMPSVNILRMGVKFKPPTLVIQYANGDGDGSGRQFRKRSMPIRGLSKLSDSYDEAEKLKKRHEKHLGGVPTVRVEKFLRLLQETMKGRTVAEALDAIKMDFSINFDEDMNKLGDRELKRRKELMDLNFDKNRVKVGDPDFVYDKQVLLIDFAF